MRGGHAETHKSGRSGWLRAAVLGANDGIVSTASLIVGVAASAAGHNDVLLAGTAALVAGALSMGAGEYVSVSSQADAEKADLAIERRALDEHPERELDELTAIYIGRGLDPALARQVAEQLTAHDDLAAHARDDIGITPQLVARPLQAAAASALAFSVGALVPLLTFLLLPAHAVVAGVMAASLVCLGVLGALAARAGGARALRGAVRVLLWSSLAMTATALIGHAFGRVFN